MVEHRVCSTKGRGFNSQGTHTDKQMYNLNALYITLDKSISYIYKCIIFLKMIMFTTHFELAFYIYNET